MEKFGQRREKCQEEEGRLGIQTEGRRRSRMRMEVEEENTCFDKFEENRQNSVWKKER